MQRKPPTRLRGEAVTLWRLSRDDQHLHCFIVEPPPNGYWLAVERAGELLYSQTYDDLDEAMLRAEGLRSPLLLAGWVEPEEH